MVGTLERPSCMWYPCGMECHLEREATCSESKVTRRERLRGLSPMDVRSICMEQQSLFKNKTEQVRRAAADDSRNDGSVWEGLRGVRQHSRLVASRPRRRQAAGHEQSFPLCNSAATSSLPPVGNSLLPAKKEEAISAFRISSLEFDRREPRNPKKPQLCSPRHRFFLSMGPAGERPRCERSSRVGAAAKSRALESTRKRKRGMSSTDMRDWDREQRFQHFVLSILYRSSKKEETSVWGWTEELLKKAQADEGRQETRE